MAAAIGDDALRLEFDRSMSSRAWRVHREGQRESLTPLTSWAKTESLLLADGTALQQFSLYRQEREAVDGPHGRGTRLTLTGRTNTGIEKRVRVELSERYPGMAFYRVSYRNLSPRAITLRGWRSADCRLLPGAAAGRPKAAHAALDEPLFWSYCGSTHADRRDWVQPVRAGFEQQNFMGMTASDYGGGTPIVDVWRRDCGIAIGHLELAPRLLSLPVKHTDEGVQLAIAGTLERTLGPDEQFETPATFIATHAGDYFATLDAYRRVMMERGLIPARAPESAYEPIWCAWGYERDCTPQLIEATLLSSGGMTKRLDRLTDAGLVISALTQREKLTEVVELPKSVHPWFIGVQFHPEFKSTPWGGHPLFTSFIAAALKHQAERAEKVAA